MAASETRLLAGRYRPVRRLGAGGMATVWLAEDEHLGRPVAVKRLHAESPEEVARRFQREARIGASLAHPNLVSVYDAVSDEEDVLLIMEYVDGPTLAQELSRRGALGPERAMEVIGSVAAALDHAHRGGVVHRDVKPANVLLGDPVKVADLGIASAVAGTQITRTGSVLGTPAYMAPEQLESGGTGPAADVYALAAVAYEALSAHKARPGRTPVEIAHRVATQPPPDLRDDWPEAPAGAAAALRRGMARDPAERPESAGALAEDLRGGLGLGDRGARSEEATRTVGAVGPDPLRPVDGPARRGPVRPGAEPLPARRSWRVAVGVLAVAAAVAIAAYGLAGGDGAPAPVAPRPAPVAQPPAANPPVHPAEDTVRDFYELSADDRFEAGWRLAGPAWRAKLQGFEGYRNTFDTLETFEFIGLEATERSASAATVETRSVARHTTFTDRCTSTFQLSRSGGQWRIDDGSVSCDRQTD